MKLNGVIPLMFWTFLFLIHFEAHARDGELNTYQDSLWKHVDTTLQNMEGDTSWHFILEKVRIDCNNEYDCLYENYYFLQLQAEQKFYIPVALYIAQEIARISKIANISDQEADAYIDQYRFYHALGDKRNCMICLDKAKEISEKAGDKSKLTYVKMIELIQSVELIPVEEVLAELNDLLEQAKMRGDENSIFLLNVNLIQLMEEYGLFEEMEKHILELEELAIGKDSSERNRILIRSTLGRAALARALKDSDEAVNQFKMTLENLQNRPDKWLDVYVHQNLSQLEWERGNQQQARYHLNVAEEKTKDSNLFEHEAENYRLKARFAEEEGKYEEALRFFKEQLRHENLWKSKSKGFSLQSYLLEKEKVKWESEKERQNLVIQLKENQLNFSRILTLFVLTLAGFLILGLFLLRKRKKVLEKLNSKIRHQAEQLQNLDENKSRFFANLSHELRTPLTLMLGPLKSVLNSNNLDPQSHSLVKTAYQNGNKLLRLVGSILNLSKMEHGYLILKENPVRLYEFVRSTISSFESHAERKGITFLFNYKGNKDLKILLDREKMADIIHNLVSNALKFTSRSDMIEVRVEDKGSLILLTVIDTGRGISEKDLPRICDRYYKSEEPGRPEEGGTGIGLAYCKEIVKLMDGKIWAESTLGEGSSFYIEIPRKEVLGSAQIVNKEMEADSWEAGSLTEVKESSQEQFSNQEKVGLKQSILIVEDNYSMRDYINSILSPSYNTFLASNGKEGLDILYKTRELSKNEMPDDGKSNGHIDLIISDIMMPIMDGFQFLETVKSSEDFTDLPVIILTARADIEDKLRALRIGVDDYLIKPFQEEEIKVRIQNLLKNAAIRDEAKKDELKSKEQTVNSEEDRLWLENFEAFIRSNISNDIINVYYIADQFAMSESTLLRQLKRLTGLSPKQYLQQMRLEHARYLLEIGKYKTIAEVSKVSGFNDPRTFSRSFKKLFGKLPSEII